MSPEPVTDFSAEGLAQARRAVARTHEDWWRTAWFDEDKRRGCVLDIIPPEGLIGRITIWDSLESM